MGIFSPHFLKPKQQFIRDMIFGIQAAKDVKLSSITQALDEPISMRKTEGPQSGYARAWRYDQRAHSSQQLLPGFI
jgi:hypothetical protein